MAKIEIFTKKNCPKCDHLKGILKDVSKVEIVIRDTAEEQYLKWMVERKLNNVPIMVIYNDNNDEMVLTYGFTKSNIANKFNEHTGGQIFG